MVGRDLRVVSSSDCEFVESAGVEVLSSAFSLSFSVFWLASDVLRFSSALAVVLP